MSKYGRKKIIRTSITIENIPLYGLHLLWQGVKANMALLIKIIKKYNFLPISDFKYNRRNLLYIDNLVDFIFISLFTENTDNQIFHNCDNESPSSLELVQEISNQFDKNIILLRYLFYF